MNTSRRHLATAIVIAVLLATALVYLGMRRYNALELIWPLDAGVLTQVACNTAHGDWLQMTLRMEGSYNNLH
ncbi:MAG: hypothetical protein P9M14_08780, partial [Candidatus Alcyoniella australis]|nr:hypothetical protein [Candidatus Alcyoniella australis]